MSLRTMHDVRAFAGQLGIGIVRARGMRPDGSRFSGYGVRVSTRTLAELRSQCKVAADWELKPGLAGSCATLMGRKVYRFGRILFAHGEKHADPHNVWTAQECRDTFTRLRTALAFS